MFIPNQIGLIERKSGRDIYGNAVLAPAVDCPFAVANAKRKSQKTTVRADSSASRGNAEEFVTDLGKILVPADHAINEGDFFSFDGVRYEISSKHIRRNTFGDHDHTECDIRAVSQ